VGGRTGSVPGHHTGKNAIEFSVRCGLAQPQQVRTRRYRALSI